MAAEEIELARIVSTDGTLTLVLSPAAINLRPSEGTVQDFDAACQEEKDSSWFPIWKHVKRGLVSAAQGLGHTLVGRMENTPLSTVREVRYVDERLEILTESGNALHGKINVEVGRFKINWDLNAPGLFREEDARLFIVRFKEVKALYDQYLAAVQALDAGLSDTEAP